MQVVLTIAGSDSCGGAGLQADLKTFAAHGVCGVSAVTAVTAQNRFGITASHIVPADVVAAQINAVADDMPVVGVKTGMLASREIVAVVATIMQMRGLRPVVDPVLMSTSGTALLDRDAVELLNARLLPLAAVVTPNITEAEQLSGVTIRTLADTREAAHRIHGLGPAAVIVTGGHLHFGNQTVIDVVHDGSDLIEVATARVPLTSGPQTHGTGCTYSAALVANLVTGNGIAEAAQKAQRFVAEALRSSKNVGHGKQLSNHQEPN